MRLRRQVPVSLALVLAGALLGGFAAPNPPAPAEDEENFCYSAEPLLPEEGEVRLPAFGDYGTGDEDQAAVLAAVAKVSERMGGYHGGLLLGDNVYFKGVKGVDDPKWREIFEEPFDLPWLRGMTWHAVLGNHDYRGNPLAQIEYTARSEGRWHMPNYYYRVDFGPENDPPVVTVLALDTNKEFLLWDEQLEWLEEQLASLAGKPQHVVVMGHHPVHNYGTHGVEKRIKERLRPLLERYHPCLYVSGHAHNLQLIKMNGTAYATLGGGGGRLHPVRSGKGSCFRMKTFGFGLIRATRERISLEFYDTRAYKPLYIWRYPRKKNQVCAH